MSVGSGDAQLRSTTSLIILKGWGDSLLVKLAEAQLFFRLIQVGYVYSVVMLWVVESASWPTGKIS